MGWKVWILRIALIGCLLAVGAGIWGYKANWWRGPKPDPFANFEPAQAVQVASVGTGSWRPTADMVGTVFALRSITVSNEVAGTVKAVYFDSGSVIEAGAPLIDLDTSTEEADLKAAEAAIRASEASHQAVVASLALAKSNYRRVTEAAEQNAISAIEVDKAKSELDTAQANLDRMSADTSQARARADQVRAVIAKKHIVAPFKGRTGIRTVHPGQYLKEGTEIVSFQGIDGKVYLDFAVPQEEAWRVKPGAVFMCTSPNLGKDPVAITVVALDSQINMATRNVRVRSIIDDPKDVMRPGMSVDVSVPLGEASQFVVVPVIAVRRATYGDHVFVIGPSKTPGESGKLRAMQRFVKLGPATADGLIVTDGLKVGEQIATVGSFKLHDGALVSVEPTPSASSEKTAQSTPGAGPTGGGD
jgi:membrane fusion protein (multidrug efflux system)